MGDITFLIKSFRRHDCVRRLIQSIREEGYGDPIIVCNDDGEQFETEDRNTKVLHSPFDIGLSAGRNRMVAEAETEYVAILDDDFIFTGETDIRRLVAKCKKGGYDLVAGALRNPDGSVQHYEGRMHVRNGIITQVACNREPYHYVFNFFVATRAALLRCQWDEELKLAEHTAYFYAHMGDLKIGYDRRCVVFHVRERSDKEYGKFRRRAVDYVSTFLKKHAIRKLINQTGTSYVEHDNGEFKSQAGAVMKAPETERQAMPKGWEPDNSVPKKK